jgi:hypothetical protein
MDRNRITSVPFTISSAGNYVVTAELVYSASTDNAITVNANNGRIDLNGHYLICSSPTNSAVGIYAGNKIDIRVRNGEILNFYNGVKFEWPGTGTSLSSGHAVDSVGFYNDYYGVLFSQTKTSVVRSCIFIGGYTGVAFLGGTGNRGTNNVASSMSYGLDSSGTDYFDSNYADHCFVGVRANSGTTWFRFRFSPSNCPLRMHGRSRILSQKATA